MPRWHRGTFATLKKSNENLKSFQIAVKHDSGCFLVVQILILIGLLRSLNCWNRCCRLGRYRIANDDKDLFPCTDSRAGHDIVVIPFLNIVLLISVRYWLTCPQVNYFCIRCTVRKWNL